MLEDCCGPLCQHPSCWSAQRRRGRGVKLPNFSQTPRDDDDDDDDDEGLPSQSIVNLLDNYGDDPADKYPSQLGGRAAHIRSSTISTMQRARTGGSVPRTRAPNATPASTVTTDKPRMSPLAHITQLNAKVRAASNKDVSKLGRVEVQEVFDPDDLKSDWNETFMAKKFYVWMPNKTARKEPKSAMTFSQGQIEVKDITEEMVPQELEWKREATRIHRCSRSPDEGMSRRSPRPPTRPSHYYGIYELLDLPRDVLVQVFDYVHERDLLDRHKFAHAIMEALPKMEKASSSLALANSDVLRQSKMKLLDGTRTVRESFPSSGQILKLDEDGLGINKRHLNAYYEMAQPHPAQQDYICDSKSLNKRKPLPSIQVAPAENEKSGDAAGGQTSLPLISLELSPKATKAQNVANKPFNYTNNKLEVTLGPVTNLSGGGKQTLESLSSDRSSSIQVTMPSLSSNKRAEANNVSVQKAPLTSYLYSLPSWELQEPPLHAVSPSCSTHVPKTPAATPATRAGMYHQMDDLNSPGSGKVRPRPDPYIYGPSGGLPQSAENVHVGLRTIPESEQDMKSLQGPIATHSIHSNRFAGEALPPPQPPSSPALSQHSPSPQHHAAEASHAVEAKNTSLNSSEQEPKKDGLQATNGNKTPGCTPEPWPQVDEDAYKKSPSPPPQQQPQKQLLDGQSPATLSSAEMSKAITRDTTKHSLKSRSILQQDKMTESPAPPPPSPDAQVLIQPHVGTPAHTITVPVITEDALDSGSELTLTARPPSNLEDISRINTPAETTRKQKSSSVLLKSSAVFDNLRDKPVSDTEPQTATEQKADSQGEDDKAEQLDQFDATQESLAAELKEEYKKLSE